MSRKRHEVPWAATSVPEIRRRWCNAIDTTVHNHSKGLEATGDERTARRMQRLQSKLADAIDTMAAENEAMRSAKLYWVSRDMVDVALDASAALPEWTPAAAAPAPNGFMCFAKPAGTVPYGKALKYTLDVPWDAVWWWTSPDGIMQIVPASRLTKNPELLEPFGVSSPLWGAHTLVLRPNEPRTDEVVGSQEAFEFVSVVGAAWLIMGQPAVAETHNIKGAVEPRRRETSDEPALRPEPPNVTLVELRRALADVRSKARKSGREYQKRFLVGWPDGFWRQQPHGPGNSQRKPKWIAPYVKGPEDAPFSPREKVHVWRR